MTEKLANARYTLAPGVRLMADQRGGVVLQTAPLRALRVNRAAFRILEQCQRGVWSGQTGAAGESATPGGLLPAFLDSLYQIGLLHWQPAETEAQPTVSIIVPVYNRAREIDECLASLLGLDYPSSRREIIVVDDGSTDQTAEVVKSYGHHEVRLILQGRNRGQSAARNAGVSAAQGELVAFIDSDCIADPAWLADLAPYFQDSRVALVGGYVASHFDQTWLDRYEEAKSPLNMGRAIAICDQRDADFYVPTCNMLVRKAAYQAAGGLDESWRVGEDVDLCWKLKKLGHRLLYLPEGRVRHKHRNRFWESYKRRFDYGTSEPALYVRHQEVRKRFPRQASGLLFFVFCSLGLVTKPWLFWPLAAVTVAVAVTAKKTEIKRKTDLTLESSAVLAGVLRNFLLLTYHLTLYAVRYHLPAIAAIIVLWPALSPPLLVLLVFPAVFEFNRLRPRLAFPVFLFFYVMEQLFYQAGVLWGAFKSGSFRCYRVHFVAVEHSAKSGARLKSRLRMQAQQR